MKRIINHWSGPGGYREVLKLAIPLILSTGAWSIQHFIDRMFLTWYSPEAIAASSPAGLLNFTILSLFIGSASYVNTFVAQYYGAKQESQVGAVVWQGIYFSFIAMGLMLLFVPLAGPLFRLAGHAPEVQILEREYFAILCLGAFFPVNNSAISGFFSGRGDTLTVMWTNILATGINIVFDYLLIFGHFGFPHLGIRGAAIATVFAAFVKFVVLLSLMLRPVYQQRFRTWSGRKLNWPLFRRLVHYGFPNGLQFFLDMFGFSLFVILVGRFGTEALAATNVAFNINTLAFMPMIGFGITVSILVGQRLGENNPSLAERSVWSAAHLTFLYMLLISISYVTVPWVFLKPFGNNADPESFEVIYSYGVVLLRFVALYSLFDTMNIVFASAIKGAGDTRFAMYAAVIVSWVVMVIPTFLASVIFNWGLFTSWIFATAYIILLGFIFLFRFLKGKWKTMRVIEAVPHATSSPFPEAPGTEFEL